MGRKKKKKATQKEISQKTCAVENEEDEKAIDFCSPSYACNGENSVMDLEEALKSKVEDQQRSFNERESICKEMISRMKEQIEMYQILQVKATYQSRRLEAEIIFLKTNLEKSNKKNEELEAEINSLKEDPEKSNKKNEELL